MPNLSFLHVSLNRDTPEGREIHEHLARIPARQRSAAVRAAVLAYFRGAGDNEKQSRKPKAKPTEPAPKRMQPGKAAADPIEPIVLTTKDGQPGDEPEHTATKSDDRLQDLLNLIQ